MKKALILLLFFFSTQGFAASNSNTKISVQESTSSGNWFPMDGSPMYAPVYTQKSKLLREKTYFGIHFALTDFNNDGVMDFLIVTNPKMPGVVWTEKELTTNLPFPLIIFPLNSVSVLW